MSILLAIEFELLRRWGRPVALVEHAFRRARRGDLQQAAELFFKAAQAGSATACLELGRAYLLGQGLPCCPAIAMQWLLRAARSGEHEAQFMVASLALQGVREPVSDSLFGSACQPPDGISDFTTALHWTQRAAEAGHAPSQSLLGFILTAGPPALRDSASGEAWYRRAAEAGCAHGQLGWSLALLRHDPVANAPEARRLLLEAARAGMPAAHHLLGILAERQGVADAAPSAVGHYRAGALLGHGPSQLAYGMALLRGHGLEPDSFLGESWIRRAALVGETEAEAALGALYLQAGVLPPNHAEAMLWFGRAAASGHTGAMRALAGLHRSGAARAADPEEALRLLRLAACGGDTAARAELVALVLAHSGADDAGRPDSVGSPEDWRIVLAYQEDMAAQGDPAAAYNVGLCCAQGLGRKADDAEALAWYRVAADRLALAQYSCGRMLAEGRGAAQDLPAARRFLLLASEQGLPEAEALAGEMLLNGRGGPQDPEAGKVLFREAAEAGHPGALYALGLIAMGCYGGPEDPDAARAYWLKAAACGHPGALAALSAPGYGKGSAAADEVLTLA